MGKHEALKLTRGLEKVKKLSLAGQVEVSLIGLFFV